MEFGIVEVTYADGSREPRGWLPRIAANVLARELAVPVVPTTLDDPVGSGSS